MGEERTITLCSLWDVSCDSLMYPSKCLGNGCNVAIQLAPSPGVEEGREVQSATKAKPQNQPRLIPRKTEKLHLGDPTAEPLTALVGKPKTVPVDVSEFEKRGGDGLEAPPTHPLNEADSALVNAHRGHLRWPRVPPSR